MSTIAKILERARNGDENARHEATVLGHNLGAEARNSLFRDVDQALREFHETVPVRRQEQERAKKVQPPHLR